MTARRQAHRSSAFQGRSVWDAQDGSGRVQAWLVQPWISPLVARDAGEVEVGHGGVDRIQLHRGRHARCGRLEGILLLRLAVGEVVEEVAVAVGLSYRAPLQKCRQ